MLPNIDLLDRATDLSRIADVNGTTNGNVARVGPLPEEFVTLESFLQYQRESVIVEPS
jgi:hypothetical protein